MWVLKKRLRSLLAPMSQLTLEASEGVAEAVSSEIRLSSRKAT